MDCVSPETLRQISDRLDKKADRLHTLDNKMNWLFTIGMISLAIEIAKALL